MEIFQRFNEETGATIVMVTHDESFAARLATRHAQGRAPRHLRARRTRTGSTRDILGVSAERSAVWPIRPPLPYAPQRRKKHAVDPEDLLPVRFGALHHALGARAAAPGTLAKLRACYGEPHRAYHDAHHIDARLRLLDDPDVAALAHAPHEVEAALCSTTRSTTPGPTTTRSAARLAEESLRAPASPRGRRARGGPRPRHEGPRRHDAGRSARDRHRLAILGASVETFAWFEDAIRQEYAWVDAPLYAAGRAAVLRRFAERPFIYGTELFRERYESRARANLAAAIDRWG